VKGLVMLLAGPVRLEQSQLDKNGLLANTVFSSSSQSWLMKGRINLNVMAMQPPTNDEEMQSQPLAVLIEGEFPSYFAGKGMPERPAEEKEAAEEGMDMSAVAAGEDAVTGLVTDMGGQAAGETFKEFTPVGAVLNRGKPGKIFLAGSAEILKNNVIDEQGSTPNATFIFNVLDDLNNRVEYAQMRSKTQRFNPIKETGAGMKTFVKMFNIAGLPILVVFFGIFVWVRRTARKRTIQAMFSR
ncbi:MAG: hypothetical protein ABIA59_10755, partial [Candidatus Latescibacterota bacterium]